MKQQKRISETGDARRSESGKSLIEIMIVVGLIIIISAIALPQLIASRRLQRSAGVSREIMTQLRYTRQQAMSQRQVVTFRYDNTTKQISVIDHQETGITYDTATSAMAKLNGATGSANAVPDVTLRTVSLATSGLAVADIVCDKPSTTAPTSVGDGTSMTAPNGSGQINITFQPDGSVVDKNSNPVGNAIFLHVAQNPNGTAFAISVLGSAGRVKLWRYDGSAYVE